MKAFAYKQVADALKDSTEVEVSKEGFHVRRRKPLESEVCAPSPSSLIFP